MASRPKLSSKAALAGFRRVRVEAHLEIVDSSMSTIQSFSHFELEATREERFFHRSYWWSGSGIEKPPQLLSGRDNLGHARHRVHGPVLRDGTHRLFLVDLGRKVQKGEKETVEIRQTFIDLGHTLEPYLGHVAREGCEQIVLQISLPDSMNARTKAQLHYGGSRAASDAEFLEPLSSSENERSKSKVFRWTIDNPKPRVNYRIVWEATPNDL